MLRTKILAKIHELQAHALSYEIRGMRRKLRAMRCEI
jgi:hypothetical protein